jgi:hypothetical protein
MPPSPSGAGRSRSRKRFGPDPRGRHDLYFEWRPLLHLHGRQHSAVERLREFGFPGVRLAQYPCDGEDQQLFQFQPQADGSFTIFSAFGLQCLENRNGRIEQQACNGGDAQKFQVK